MDVERRSLTHAVTCRGEKPRAVMLGVWLGKGDQAMMRWAVIYDFFHGTDKMLTIWKRAFIICLGFVAVIPLTAQPEVSFTELMKDVNGRAPAQRSAPSSPTVGSKTLAVEEKQVTYSVGSSGLVRFTFDAKGYRNTYMLDCEKRLFLWIENVRLSTGEVTDNNAGAEWKPLTPNSTISNAVHEVGCRQVLAVKGEGDGNKAGTNAQKPSFDCSHAKSWSEKTVCNNPTAAALDLQVSRLYNTARAQATDTRKVELKNAQLEWLRKRENCEQYSDKTECLLNVYHDRVAELGSLIPAAEDMGKAAPDGYTVPKLTTITLEADTLEIVDLDSFLGIWEYPDTDSKEPTNYLKIIRINAHQFRLIEGHKNWYVNDKDKIRWFDRRQDTFEPEPPMIYLQPSEGKLVGQFVSGAFRPTHGEDFTYRLTLEKKSPNTLRYSVWLSDDGKDGSTETFEATKVAGDFDPPETAEHTERKSSSSSTGTEVPADKIQVKDGSSVSGKIAGGKVPFKSSLGTVDVNVKDVQSFSDGKLYLADGTVLTGAFASGSIEIAASVGTFQVPADNVLSIVRAGQSVTGSQGSSNALSDSDLLHAYKNAIDKLPKEKCSNIVKVISVTKTDALSPNNDIYVVDFNAEFEVLREEPSGWLEYCTQLGGNSFNRGGSLKKGEQTKGIGGKMVLVRAEKGWRVERLLKRFEDYEYP